MPIHEEETLCVVTGADLSSVLAELGYALPEWEDSVDRYLRAQEAQADALEVVAIIDIDAVDYVEVCYVG